ncbi:MAG: CHAT domain-containing tetratricopeptide repeat protein [Saprospiraceae bacterium]|nr:CHAT domain-containing protein [Saprospiraceae bacterium]MDW8231002.1 CHAT domain-containing tetratricopeptide repeat protein [Saprospiraceae bacterium]
MAILKTALRSAWRQPEGTAEGEAFLWVKVNEGYHLYKIGRILESVEAYEAAWSAWQRWSPPEFEVLEYIVLPLGAHHTRLGDNEKARTLYEMTLEKFSATAHPALAGIYNNLGLTWWNEGHYGNARRVFAQGLKVRGITPVHRGLLHLSMAQAYFDEAYADSADFHLKKSFFWLEKARGHADAENVEDYLAGAFLLKGRLLSHRQSYSEALVAYNAALRLKVRAIGTTRHRDVGKIQVAIGELYLKRHQPDDALRAFHRALTDLIPAFPPDDLQAVPDSTSIYEENTLSAALRGKAAACFELYRRNHRVELLHTALGCFQMAWLTDTRLRFALQYESSKLTLVAQQRKSEEKALDVAYALWQQTGEERYLLEGWAIAERARAVLLLDNLLRLHHQQHLSQLPPRLKEIVRVRRQLAWVEQQLILEPDAPQRTEWLRQRQQLLDRLHSEEQKNLTWKAVFHQSTRWSATSVSQLAAQIPTYGILEYFVGSDHIEIFSVQHGKRAAWTRIAQPGVHAAAVQQLLRWMQAKSPQAEGLAAYRELAFSTYQQLVLPAIREASINASHLLIIPDRWLAFLPFEALITENHLKNWQQAPWLLRRYSVCYAYSMAVFEVQSRMVFSPKANILQAAPMFENGRHNLSPLRYSLQETPARDLCASRILMAEEAAWSLFESVASEYAVLNLSTHAAASAHGGEPAIEFYDGPVLLPKAYSLSLQADLVVLSACESGLGNFHDGEGVMSMARAFTYAGSKGLVTSLWVINESATASILARMYRYLRKDEPKNLALHTAKLSYLDDEHIPAFQKSPYYWAALVYIGDTARIRWQRCPWQGAIVKWGAVAVLMAGVVWLLIRHRRKRLRA